MFIFKKKVIASDSNNIENILVTTYNLRNIRLDTMLEHRIIELLQNVRNIPIQEMKYVNIFCRYLQLKYANDYAHLKTVLEIAKKIKWNAKLNQAGKIMKKGTIPSILNAYNDFQKKIQEIEGRIPQIKFQNVKHLSCLTNINAQYIEDALFTLGVVLTDLVNGTSALGDKSNYLNRNSISLRAHQQRKEAAEIGPKIGKRYYICRFVVAPRNRLFILEQLWKRRRDIFEYILNREENQINGNFNPLLCNLTGIIRELTEHEFNSVHNIEINIVDVLEGNSKNLGMDAFVDTNNRNLGKIYIRYDTLFRFIHFVERKVWQEYLPKVKNKKRLSEEEIKKLQGDIKKLQKAVRSPLDHLASGVVSVFDFLWNGRRNSEDYLSAYAENYGRKPIDAVARAAMASSDENVKSASAD